MDKLDNNESDFYAYMNKLNEMYEKNPKKVKKEVRETLVRLNAFENSGILHSIDINKLIFVILVIIIALFGLFNIPTISMYVFGEVFFIAGHLVGLYVSGPGLIFLFSHSVTGMVLMEYSLLSRLFENPIMTDNPQNIYLYLVVNIALLVIATIIVILYNLSNGYNGKKYVPLISLGIYTLAFFMSAILPSIANFVYTFRF